MLLLPKYCSMSIVINIGQSKHYQVDFLDFLRQILFRFSFLNICYLKCDEPIIITPIHFKFQPDPPCLKGFQWVSLQDSGGHTCTKLKFLCIQQSDAALFCENYTKLYFDAKHFFSKKLFLANIGCCPNFLD